MASASGHEAVGDVEAYLDHEILQASNTLTSQLFHYTTANAAISGILRSGEFRLSPFDGTNDLWESRPLYPSLAVHADDQSPDPEMRLWEEIDKHIRRHAKVGCFTQDWELPDSVFDRDALRGWAHLSLWAHYGGGHTGICLRFDRERLVAALEQSTEEGLHRFHGQVFYARVSLGPLHAIDVGQVNEFGADAVSLAFAVLNRDAIFFRKHADWATESEYRLVLVGGSVAPAYIDIREALTGAVLGESFPSHRMPELRAELARYPDVELLKLAYHNRQLFCFPPSASDVPPPEPGGPAAPAHRQPGAVRQRVADLLAAVEEAEVRRVEGAAIADALIAQTEAAVSVLLAGIETWSRIDARLHTSVTAIPEGLRARAPGVPGERVHFQSGLMCVGENVPMCSHTLVAAVAIQVLDGGRVRLHGLVSTERWHPDGNTTVEHWRDQRDVHGDRADGELDELLTELQAAVLRVRSVFDKARLT